MFPHVLNGRATVTYAGMGRPSNQFNTSNYNGDWEIFGFSREKKLNCRALRQKERFLLADS